MKYEIFSFNDPGYKTLMSYQSWRVAILNFIDELLVDNLSYVESHSKTDEVFVLLEGEGSLIFADVEANVIQSFEVLKLEKHKVYNIKKGIYHTHVLSKNCKLLIVEEKDTSDENSIRIYLEKEHIEEIKENNYEKVNF